jgi:hypothetical protein
MLSLCACTQSWIKNIVYAKHTWCTFHNPSTALRSKMSTRFMFLERFLWYLNFLKRPYAEFFNGSHFCKTWNAYLLLVNLFVLPLLTNDFWIPSLFFVQWLVHFFLRLLFNVSSNSSTFLKPNLFRLEIKNKMSGDQTVHHIPIVQTGKIYFQLYL